MVIDLAIVAVVAVLGWQLAAGGASGLLVLACLLGTAVLVADRLLVRRLLAAPWRPEEEAVGPVAGLPLVRVRFPRRPEPSGKPSPGVARFLSPVLVAVPMSVLVAVAIWLQSRW